MTEHAGPRKIEPTFQRRQIATFSGSELNGFRKVLAKINPDKAEPLIKHINSIPDERERDRTEMAFRVILTMAGVNAGLRNTREYMDQLASVIVWQTGPSEHDRQVEYQLKPVQKGI